MKWLLVIVCFLCSGLVAQADDAGVRGVGGAVEPLDQHPSIRMVREKVHIILGPTTASVRCEFVFKNEGPAITAKIGFPERNYGDSAHPIKSSDLKSFRSWVDGRSVKTKLVPSANKGDEQEYEAWHVKDVHFSRGQTRVIVDQYATEYGGDSMGGIFLNYILKTGGNWKGTIGEALITVDASQLANYWRVTPMDPKGSTVKGSKITWLLKDFEPSDNVYIYIERKQNILIGGMRVLNYDAEIYTRRGITVAPITNLRDFAQISWDKAHGECSISYQGNTLTMRPGSKTAILNKSEKIQLPETPYIRWSSFRVPILAVAKAVGMKLGYDQKTGNTSILGEKRENS